MPNKRLWFDQKTQRFFHGRNPLKKLSLRALKALTFFAQSPHTPLTKDELIEYIWGEAFIGHDSVYQVIRELRQALESDPKKPVYIVTWPRVGYIFRPEGKPHNNMVNIHGDGNVIQLIDDHAHIHGDGNVIQLVDDNISAEIEQLKTQISCLLYTSPSPRDPL